VNLSVDVGLIDLMRPGQELGVPFLDTVIEPWPGFCFGSTVPNSGRTSYPLRETVRALARTHAGGPTSVSCCGSNRGTVSWLPKEALLRLAAASGHPADAPASREDRARLMGSLGARGVPVADRDMQVAAPS
jgi:homospermidine synthase